MVVRRLALQRRRRQIRRTRQAERRLERGVFASNRRRRRSVNRRVRQRGRRQRRVADEVSKRLFCTSSVVARSQKTRVFFDERRLVCHCHRSLLLLLLQLWRQLRPRNSDAFDGEQAETGQRVQRTHADELPVAHSAQEASDAVSFAMSLQLLQGSALALSSSLDAHSIDLVDDDVFFVVDRKVSRRALFVAHVRRDRGRNRVDDVEVDGEQRTRQVRRYRLQRRGGAAAAVVAVVVVVAIVVDA